MSSGLTIDIVFVCQYRTASISVMFVLNYMTVGTSSNHFITRRNTGIFIILLNTAQYTPANPDLQHYPCRRWISKFKEPQ